MQLDRYVGWKAPNSLAQNQIWTLPNATVAQGVLRTDGAGRLAWVASTPPMGPASGALTNNFPNPQLANNSVNSETIAAQTIQAEDIANSAIQTHHLLENSIVTAKIIDAAISSQHIANSSITNAILAASAVDTSKIADQTRLTVTAWRWPSARSLKINQARHWTNAAWFAKA